MADFGQMSINGLMLGLTLALFVLGLTLTFGIMNILNFAHPSIYTISGLTVWYLTEREGINYWLTILIAMAAGAVIGVVVEKLAFRPFYRNPMGGMLVALGVLYMLDGSTMYTLEETVGMVETYTYQMDSVIHGTFEFGGMIIAKERVMIMLISLALITGLIFYLNYTKQGWAIKATAQNQDAALLQGVSTSNMARNTMLIGSVLAAMGAGLVGPVLGVATESGGIALMIKGMVAVALGGLGSVPGSIIACIILGLVESYVTTELESGQLAYVFVFSILAITLIVRPGGLLGKKEVPL